MAKISDGKAYFVPDSKYMQNLFYLKDKPLNALFY